MNAQQEAVALFKFLEDRGFRPSVRSIGRALRDQGVPFRETSMRAWLAPFVESRDASRSQADATGTQKTSTGDATGTQADATGTRLRARNKVSLVSKPEPTVPGEPVTAEALPLLTAGPVAEPAKTAKKAPRAPSSSDLAAWALLAAFADRIGPLEGLPVKDWKARNKAAALSMLASGVPAEDWLAFWDEAQAAGYRYVKLANMQAAYAARAGRTEEANTSDRLQTLTEMYDSGKIEKPDEAAMIASRPKWFNDRLAQQAAG